MAHRSGPFFRRLDRRRAAGRGRGQGGAPAMKKKRTRRRVLFQGFETLRRQERRPAFPSSPSWPSRASRRQRERPADARAESALDTWLATIEPWGELQALRAAVESCPRGTRVVLGNSLPVREADLVLPAGDIGLQSFAVRGASGIDGILSVAVGAALGDVGPTLVLLGDVSFAHDMGALYAARDVRNPLAIVVLDNRGGRIFEQLPIHASVTPDELKYWTTPHELNLDAAGSIYGIETLRSNDLNSIRLGVRDALQRSGATLLVISIDPDSPRKDAKSLRNAVKSAVFDPKLSSNPEA